MNIFSKELEKGALLKTLAEKYALRAREFSDTVALLGHHAEVTPEVLELFKKIKLRRGLCADAEKEIEQYLLAESSGRGAA
jgi:hypothetical protein